MHKGTIIKEIFYTVFKTSLGYLGAARTLNGLHTIILPKRSANEVVSILKKKFGIDCVENGQDFGAFYKKISDYFSGKSVRFDVRIDLEGASGFEKRVWLAAAAIPWGQVRSYEWMARSIGHPGACRAVGLALSRNRLPIVIPCHRVVKKNGDIGGFAEGLSMKRSLLKIEGKLL